MVVYGVHKVEGMDGEPATWDVVRVRGDRRENKVIDNFPTYEEASEIAAGLQDGYRAFLLAVLTGAAGMTSLPERAAMGHAAEDLVRWAEEIACRASEVRF